MLAEPKSARVAPTPASPVEVLPTSSPPTGRGKVTRHDRQELIDELQQNYREVVSLVRRVNDHMDRADSRAERVTTLAEQVLETTRGLPSSVAEGIERGQAGQIQSLQTIAQRQEEGTERVELSIAQLGVQMEVASQSHEQLVTSMADFRETMHDMSVTNTRTADAIDASIAQKRAADDRLAAMIVQNQRWMIGIVAGIMVFAASAFIVAVIALLQMKG